MKVIRYDTDGFTAITPCPYDVAGGLINPMTFEYSILQVGSMDCRCCKHFNKHQNNIKGEINCKYEDDQVSDLSDLLNERSE